jgi:glutathione S-transferase
VFLIPGPGLVEHGIVVLDPAVVGDRIAGTDGNPPSRAAGFQDLAGPASDLAGRAPGGDAALTLADLALVSAVLYLDLRQPQRDWRSEHPNLAKWCERVSARRSVQTTLEN